MKVVIKLLDIALEILKILEENGYEAYLVGGAVRDRLLGLELYDFDMASSALPEEVMKIFDAKPTGIKYGTVTINYKGLEVEITTFRKEEGYINHRHPDKITFTKSVKEDFKRRDFTINALYMNKDLKILDFCDGLNDLKNKTIRSINSPFLKFSEDALRIIRAFRLVAKTGFDIEKETLDAINETKTYLSEVSPQRLLTEFRKVCGEKYSLKAYKLMEDLNIFEIIGLNYNKKIEKDLSFLELFIKAKKELGVKPSLYDAILRKEKKEIKKILNEEWRRWNTKLENNMK